MSSNTDLIFPTAIDLKGLDRDLSTALSAVGGFADSASSRLTSISSPSIHVDASKSAAGGGKSGGAAQLASSLIPAGGLIAAGLTAALNSALGPLASEMKKIGRAISRQLNEAFTFDQLKDGIAGTKDIFEHQLKVMRRDLDAFSHSGQASNAALFDKMKQQIRDVEYQFKLFLMHSQANLKKGGVLPNFDTLFSNKSKTYTGKGKGDPGSKPASAIGSVAGAINPMKLLRKETEATHSSMLKLGAAAGVVVGALAGFGAAAGFVAHGVKSASNLNETLSKTDIVLGTASPGVKAFADDVATRFGLVKGTTLDVASSFGGLARSLGGLKGEKLGGFSKQFTMLSADLSSFANIDMAAASEAISTTLAGNQSDTLKGLGVIITEDTVKSYAFAHGIAKAGEELNEQQKFAARSALIMQGLSKVNGDLERTQGGAANQGRKFWGILENLGTTVGAIILPVFTEGLVLLNEFGGKALKVFTDNQGVIESWKESFLSAFDWVVATVHNFPAAFEVARIKIAEVLINIGEYFEVLGPNAVLIASYIGNNFFRLIRDGLMLALTVLQNFFANVSAVGTALGTFLADPTRGFKVEWTGLTEGFVATADKLPGLIKPTLTDLSKEIQKAGEPISAEVAKRRADRAAAAAKAGIPLSDADTPASAAAAKKKGAEKKPDETKFAGALELGSKEAYSSVASAAAGSSKDDRMLKAGDETARNTRAIADHFQRNPPKNRKIRKVRI